MLKIEQGRKYILEQNEILKCKNSVKQPWIHLYSIEDKRKEQKSMDGRGYLVQ